MAFIYVVTNMINGKQYVGQTTESIQQRFSRHCRSAENQDKDGNCPFHLAILKYGRSNFKIEQLEECPVEQLNEREIY